MMLLGGLSVWRFYRMGIEYIQHADLSVPPSNIHPQKPIRQVSESISQQRFYMMGTKLNNGKISTTNGHQIEPY